MVTATYFHLSSCICITVQHADSLLSVLFIDSPWLWIILLNLENGLRDKNWNPCVSCWIYKPPTPPFQNDFGDTISDKIGHKVQFAGTQPNMATVVLHNWINNLVINFTWQPYHVILHTVYYWLFQLPGQKTETLYFAILTVLPSITARVSYNQ